MRFFLLCPAKAPKTVEHQVDLLEGLKWAFVTLHDYIHILTSSFLTFIGVKATETLIQIYIQIYFMQKLDSEIKYKYIFNIIYFKSLPKLPYKLLSFETNLICQSNCNIKVLNIYFSLKM